MSWGSVADNVRLWLHSKLDQPWKGSRVAHGLNSEVMSLIVGQWKTLDTTLKLRLLATLLSIKKSNLTTVQTQMQDIINLTKEDPDDWVLMIGGLLATSLTPEGSHLNFTCIEENNFASTSISKLKETLAEVKEIDFVPMEATYLQSVPWSPKPNTHFTVKKSTPRWTKPKDSITSSTDIGLRSSLTSSSGGPLARSTMTGSSSNVRPAPPKHNPVNLFSRPSPSVVANTTPRYQPNLPSQPAQPGSGVTIIGIDAVRQLGDSKKEKSDKDAEKKSNPKKRDREPKGDSEKKPRKTAEKKGEAEKRVKTAENAPTQIIGSPEKVKPADLSSTGELNLTPIVPKINRPANLTSSEPTKPDTQAQFVGNIEAKLIGSGFGSIKEVAESIEPIAATSNTTALPQAPPPLTSTTYTSTLPQTTSGLHSLPQMARAPMTSYTNSPLKMPTHPSFQSLRPPTMAPTLNPTIPQPPQPLSTPGLSSYSVTPNYSGSSSLGISLPTGIPSAVPRMPGPAATSPFQQQANILVKPTLSTDLYTPHQPTFMQQPPVLPNPLTSNVKESKDQSDTAEALLGLFQLSKEQKPS